MSPNNDPVRSAQPGQAAEDVRGEGRMAAALKPFGWTCTEDFWRRYYTDPWVFNLANAVERLTDEVARLQRQIDGTQRG